MDIQGDFCDSGPPFANRPYKIDSIELVLKAKLQNKNIQFLLFHSSYQVLLYRNFPLVTKIVFLRKIYDDFRAFDGK